MVVPQYKGKSQMSVGVRGFVSSGKGVLIFSTKMTEKWIFTLVFWLNLTLQYVTTPHRAPKIICYCWI